MPKTIADLEREPFGIVFRRQGSETKAQAFARLLEANPSLRAPSRNQPRAVRLGRAGVLRFGVECAGIIRQGE